MRERDPELPDVAQRFAMYWINRDPKRPLAVRRLLPWIHLRHGDLPLRGNLILSTGFSPRFRAFEPGFPRSPPFAHGWLADLICVRSPYRRIPICADAPSTRDTLLTNAVRPDGASSSNAPFLGRPFWLSRLGLHFGGRGGDAEQGTGDAGVRGEAADGACGFARHPRFSCGDCDRRREHHFRRRPGLADTAHSSRGRRQCWWRHRYFRAFDRAAAGGDSRPSGRGRE